MRGTDFLQTTTRRTGPSHVLTVRVPVETHGCLKASAAAEETSVGSVVRRAVAAHLRALPEPDSLPLGSSADCGSEKLRELESRIEGLSALVNQTLRDHDRLTATHSEITTATTELAAAVRDQTLALQHLAKPRSPSTRPRRGTRK